VLNGKQTILGAVYWILLFCSLRGRSSSEVVLSGDLKPDSRERLCGWQFFQNQITMKLYVGNLSFETTENDLQDLFEQHGQVSEVSLMMDRLTGKSRGFAFVTMPANTEADAAMTALNGKELSGRTLTVNEARAREERPRPYGANRYFAGNRR
jgi:cold-inducible RNA-binding protein